MPLDRNESYWLLDDELENAAHASGKKVLSTYPEYDELKHALATYSGVSEDHLLITPGSDAAIEHIARAYAGEGDTVILPVPTFYGYESILERVGLRILPMPYEEHERNFVFPLVKTIDALHRGAGKILFLCHPNNPLGSPLPKDVISELVLAAQKSDTLIVSDEAYFEFSSGTSFLPFLADLPNLVIIRTLSKAFALSGVRVGYAIARPEVVKRVEKFLLPWPVTHLSVYSALALLSRVDAVRARRELVIAEREHFTQELCKISGIYVYPSETNFVLVRIPDAGRIRDALSAQGIRVALGESMSRFPDAKKLLKDTLRIAIPAPESERQFLDVLTAVLN